MGTSCAVNHANLYVAFLEITEILNSDNFKNSLLFFRRFIDDGIGVWLPQSGSPNLFQDLPDTFNGYGDLQWTTQGLEKSVIFLDFIVITHGTNNILKFMSYSKLMNLFLYIPAHSAHPPGAIKGMIYGMLYTAWRINSDVSDFSHYTKEFFLHLKIEVTPVIF